MDPLENLRTKAAQALVGLIADESPDRLIQAHTFIDLFTAYVLAVHTDVVSGSTRSTEPERVDRTLRAWNAHADQDPGPAV